MDRFTYTKPRKNKRTTPKRKVPVTVSCLYCNKSFPKSHLEIGVIRTKICCGDLSKHLSSQAGGACYDHYANNYMKNGDFDFYPSLSSHDKQEHRELFSSKHTNTINSFSPPNFGLTGTGNGPIPANNPAFPLPNLNMQTIYDANQPQVSCAVIVNNLLNNPHSEFMSNDDQDQADNRLPYDLSLIHI